MGVSKVRDLTLSAVSAALGVVILYIASFLPTLRLALLCVASLSVVVVYIRSGRAWALGTYAVVSALGLILSPDKSESLVFTLFLGYYPILLFPFERIAKRALRLLAKLAVFNLAFTVLFGFMKVLLRGSPDGRVLFVLYVLANLAFLVYDFALRKLILFYMRKIDGRVK